MSKITKKFVREVKKHIQKNWHDQEWHNFNRKKETIAVCSEVTEKLNKLES